jgi:hypothetical protein
MATEKLKIRLELYATMWDLPPHVEIIVGDKSYFDGNITGTENKPDIIEFVNEFEEGQSYFLRIKRSGKLGSQTVVNEKGEIIKDQLLHIKNLEIDSMDLGSLVYEGVYVPEYPDPWATQQKQKGIELASSFKNAKDLGHNGTWTLKFDSPFYLWLLENLY